ncbi:protein FAR1-RELATED SEQUENCE 5-like [Arachis ipaensis]|nr:protein FAR1-RELATED SEQUENCE 5-like [Arachis ipaensis]
MAPAAFCNLLPSHRKMSDGDKAQVNSMKQFGIPTSKIMAYMAGQSGGYNMLRFTKRDLYNYVDSQRRARILDGDAAATISYLEGKENADLMSVARYTTTVDNRLGNLFWVDGFMKSDYELFGDVVAFDAMYRGNKYKKPLDEEVCTYRWVLTNLLDVMGQRTMNLVVTDGDKAMRATIAEVMPSAKHRLCAWHLEKNCVQRVKEAEFRKVFKKAIYVNFHVDEFERYWRTSIESLSLGQNTWVQATYDIKESWATAYLRGTFCAGYRTTSRCEGINSFIKAFLKSTDSILELVHSLDRVVKDFGTMREVKKQIKGVATLLFQGRESISMTIVYSFSKMGRPDRVFKVLYDPNDRKIECECKM